MLHETDARLPGAVEVWIIGYSLLLHGLHEGPAHRGVLTEMRDLQRAVDPMVGLAEVVVRLLPSKVRQEIAETPTRPAERRVPGVVVGRLPATVDHRVDRTAPAEHPGLGHDRRPPAELRLCDDTMHREVGIPREELHVSRGHPKDRTRSPRPRLDEQNPSPVLGHQAARHDAAGTSTPGDDI